jgi:penicillin-binding protein 2
VRAETSAIRLSVLGVTVLGLFAALFSRLWFLQVAAAPGLEVTVASNRIRTVALPPARGRILDVVGRVVADNRQGLSVVIDQNEIRNTKKRAALFGLLAGPLNRSVDELQARYDSNEYSRLLPLPLAEDVSETDAMWIRERIVDYPGVDVVVSTQRSYRFAPTGSNIVGYMGKIQKETLKKYTDKGYQQNELVGIYGVEKSFEDELRGTPGFRKVQVDSNNRVVREVERVEPIPGNDIQLTVDLKMQQYVELILQSELVKRRQERPPRDTDFINGGKKGPEKQNFSAPDGAVVLEDATNGAIVAMASNPGFDSRWYDGKTSGAVLSKLFGFDEVENADGGDPIKIARNNSPLFDRAVSGTFSIGSTMKLFTSIAGIRNGMIDSKTTFVDTGKWTMPGCDKTEPSGCDKQNAGGAVYGKVNLSDAIMVSDDTYFYDLGARLWLETAQGTDPLQNELRHFGMGSTLGIRLPGEQAGLIPDKEAKKKLAEAGIIDKFAGSKYFTGDNVNLAIGQGLLGVTPLQLANAYGAFANGGTVWRPRVVKALYESGTPDLTYGLADLAHATKIKDYDPEIVNHVDLPAEIVEPIRDGLRRVLYDQLPNGQAATAKDTFSDWDFGAFPIWGKTGTAQVGENKDWNDTSLFASFGGPPDNPAKYAVASIIEKAGFGGQASAPLVKCIWTALSQPDVVPELLPISTLDRNQVVPRLWTIPEKFDASCLKIDFALDRKEH